MEVQKETLALVEKKRKGFNDLRQIILNVRNQTLKMSDAVIEFGLKLVKNHKSQLGDEYYIILEEIFYAGLEIGSNQTVRLSEKCLRTMKEKFPESDKVERMEAMCYEAKRDDAHCFDILKNKMSQNLLDVESQKRAIANFRREGEQTRFIQEMNDYLSKNCGDGEAWMELGDLYLETLNYNKAVYCYEELVVLFPKKFFYMMKIAEIYYTLGGSQNLMNAKHYYSFVLSKDSQNHRAQWGLIQTCRKLQQLKKDEKIEELLKLLVESMKQQYKKKNDKVVEKINWSLFLK